MMVPVYSRGWILSANANKDTLVILAQISTVSRIHVNKMAFVAFPATRCLASARQGILANFVRKVLVTRIRA